MKVTRIDIADMHFSGNQANHQGYVTMQLEPVHGGTPIQVQFLCHADQPEDCPSTIVTHDLIKDALRQAHRMPGFRRGEQVIEVEISTARIAPRSASG